jgi:hypothetical protein
VLPLLHVTVPEQPVALKVAFCVPQMLVISAVICGAIGAKPLDICIWFELPLIPHEFVQVAV